MTPPNSNDNSPSPAGDFDSSKFDFSSDEKARESMKEFIRENFSDLLGDKLDLLDEPDGFQKIQEAFEREINDASKNVGKNINQLMSILKRLGK